MKRFCPALLLIGLLGWMAGLPLSAAAQDLTTTISTSGGEVIIEDDSNLQVDDPFSENPVLILTPKADFERARAMIQNGTEITTYLGERIRYHAATDAFLLEGNGRIERGQDFLEGPTRIEYIPDENIMRLVGNEANPAQFSVITQDRRNIAVAREIHFLFEEVEGDRELKRIVTVDTQSARMVPGNYEASAPLMRKMSGPGSTP